MSKPYAAYKKGEIVELPEQQAESLIAWEYATRAADADQPLLETPATPKPRRKQSP